MSSTRLTHSHHASKSTVLAGAGVQDAYWSDDEDEDAECPLCLEEMDVAEMGFKPCPCGYQICMFCYHHIKSNLNGRCPACRREYTEENVQFTAVPKEDVKRQTQQKKRKERERKELEALGRRHFANVRVVQRNVVYVVGLGSRFAKEELIPTLRSNEYFGQYGKISKIILVKRHLPGSKSPVVGLYITYHRREDAARAIHAVDGSPSPGSSSSGEVMRASHGTTKYCMSFLRGQNCSNNSCLDLHEWGDKNDCFTKEDLTTLKHSMKDSENQPRLSTRKKAEEHEATPGLPRGTSWGHKAAVMPVVSQPSTSSRQPRSSGGRSRTQPQSRTAAQVADGNSRSSGRGHDRRAPAHASSSSVTSGPSKTAGNAPSQGSASSRPTTPVPPTARPLSPSSTALARPRALEPPPRSTTPASSVALDSDVGSADTPLSPAPASAPTSQATSIPAVPPGLPALSTYQLSTQAQALLDDVRARRVQSHTQSPFPEFDRTLDSLNSGGFSFTWSMDPKIASPSTGAGGQEYRGSFDPFAASASGSGTRQFPQLSGPPVLPPATPPPLHAKTYRGSFNPFADAEPVSPSLADSGDGSRQESRFGFARRRTSPSANGSPNLAAFTSSPLTDGSPLPMFQQQHVEAQGPWGYPTPAMLSAQQPPALAYEYPQGHVHAHAPLSVVTPLIASPTFRPQQTGYIRFQPFDSAEPERVRRTDTDPATAPSFAGPAAEHVASPVNQHSMYATPPGLPPRRDSTISVPILAHYHNDLPQRQPSPVRAQSHRGSSLSSTPAYASPHASSTSASTPPAAPPAPILLSTDFPALPTPSVPESQSKREQTQPYILPAPPKLMEPKVAPQPAIPTRKHSKSTTKESKVATRAAETSIKSTAPTPSVPAKVTKGRKNEKKEEAKAALAPMSEFTPSIPAPVELKKMSKPTPAPVKATPPPHPVPEPIQAPLFSKAPKKSKPVQPKVIKIPRDDGSQSKPSPDEYQKEVTPPPPAAASKPSVSEVQQSDAPTTPIIASEPFSVSDLLDQLARKGLDLPSLVMFNPNTVDSDFQTPLQYDPLVHALSALSVGGGSFANNLPSVSIDSAVSSFQQLLETLTQTISDLLRLLPRTTWEDSSSFDGVLRDMLKGDDFLDDVGEDGGREDEVAALTLALERRARWMEVQLAKLEELHRDINTAAVRAILTFNDRGWDSTGFLPRGGSSLPRFDSLGYVPVKGRNIRPMTLDELQRASEKAKMDEKAVRQALQESMEIVRDLLPYEDDDE